MGQAIKPNTLAAVTEKGGKRSQFLSPKLKRDTLAALLFLAPNMLGFMVFVAGPSIASLVISFFNWPLVGTPTFVGLANFRRLIVHDELFRRVLSNTTYYVITYVTLNIVCAMVMALWITKRDRFAALLRSVFFMPVVIPVAAVAMVWRLMFQPSHGLFNLPLEFLGIGSVRWLSDARFAMPAVVIMSVWFGFGYNLVIFIAAIKGIPETYLDAGTIDGANEWQLFHYIKLPSISPAVFFALVMTIITSFQVFGQTFVLTGGGPANATNTIVFYLFQQGFQFFRMGYASAIAWVLFGFIFIFTVIQSRLQKKWVHYE